LLLALFERMQGMRIIDMLAVFGGAPMFFYLLHLSVLRILYHSALAYGAPIMMAPMVWTAMAGCWCGMWP
jgi:uncharacterized membrane protein